MNDLLEALNWVGRTARTLLAAVGVAAIFAFVAFVVLSGSAQAQTLCPAKPTCDPVTTKDRGQCGAELKGTTATGQWRAWWFPVTKTATRWEWCPFKWAMLDKYAPTDPRSVIAVVDALKDAPDVPTAIMDALTAKSINPAVGSKDEFEFKTLHYTACQALLANPPTTWTTPLPAPCVQPTPPTPPVESWKAIGGTIFTYATGKLTGVTAKKAARDAPATCATAQAIVGARIFCQLTGGPANEVTEVTK